MVDAASSPAAPKLAAEGVAGTSSAPREGGAPSTSAAAAASSEAPLPPLSPAGEPALSIVVHTTAPFGAMYVDTDPERVEAVIVEHLRRLLPGLPAPLETKCHRWRLSQVTTAYHGPEPFVREDISSAAPAAAAAAPASLAKGAEPVGAAGGVRERGGLASMLQATSAVGAILIVDDPPLLLAGDAFSESNFEGCIASAEKATALLLQTLKALHPLSSIAEAEAAAAAAKAAETAKEMGEEQRVDVL